MKRLHQKLYLAVVATLVAFMIAGALVWHFLAPREAFFGVQSAARVVVAVFESAAGDPVREDALLDSLAWQLGADVALHAPGRSVPQLSRGYTLVLPADQLSQEGWQMTREGPIYNQPLPDGRRLIIHPRQRFLLHGLHLGLALCAVAVALALVIYPITRGVTARLGRLETSVRELGEGNLSARVAVEGEDEVAALARAFNQSAARVEQLVASHKLLLANCSHELRTPLARIRMAVEKLAGPQSPAGEELARSIAELDGLIGEMLLSSRLDALRRPEREEAVDLLALVAEEAAHFGCEPVGESVWVRGDPTLLRRMVRNLLDNARLHAGGASRVAVGRAAAGWVQLVVEDQGPGVPSAERARIFEPFQQGSAGAAAPRGAGLGLAIVRQVARAHGGDVSYADLASQDAAGARFTVRLPEAAADASR